MPKQTVTPFLRGRIYWGLIPMPSGRGKGRSLGTSDEKAATKICRFLEKLHDDNEWYLLGRLADGTADITAAYAAYTKVKLPQHIQALKNGPVVIVDIEPHVAQWAAEMKRLGKPAPETQDRYVSQVRTLIPEGKPFLLTHWTRATVKAWLTNLGIDSSNRQRAAASGFAKYLIEEEVCEHNPVLAVAMKKEPAPRCRYLSQAEAKAVIGAMSGVAQVYHAACAATGLEYQAARRLRFRDVDMFSGTMLADGKKTTGRGRTATQYRRWIWAWVYVVSHVTQNLGIDANACVFAELSEWEMRQALKDACEKVGVADYRPHDWRHTWAVQAIRDGFPLNTVAAQLGHKDAVMTLRVYGKFQPIATDFERVNATLLAEEEKEAAAGMHAAIDQAMAEGKPIEL